MGAAWAAAIAGLAGAGASAYGASQASGSDPGYRDYRETGLRYLNRLIPEWWNVNRKYAPLLTDFARRMTKRGAVQGANILKRLGPVSGILEEKRVGRELDLVAGGAPRVAGILEGYRPHSGVFKELTSQAGEGLAAKMDLTQTERDKVAEEVRASQSARGMGYGPADAYEEAVALTVAGRDAWRERQRFAGNTVQLGNEFYGDPWGYIYGGSGVRPTTPETMLGIGQAGVQQVPLGPIGSGGGQAYYPSNPGANAAMAAGGSLLGAGGQFGGAYWANRPQTPPRQQQNYWNEVDWGGGY